MKSNDTIWKELNTLSESLGVTIQPAIDGSLVFEENIHLKCFYCGRYGRNWRCPPKTPSLDYQKIMSELDNRAFVYKRFAITSENKEDVRIESTNHLHKSLLAMERALFDAGKPTALSFIGGSCKLCKSGCGADCCNNPYEARMPLEATGMNIIKTAAKHGIRIDWPVVDNMLRLGMLLW